MKIKAVYIFNLLASIILVVSLSIYKLFNDTKTMVIDTNFQTNISYVRTISDNIVKMVLSKIDSNLDNLNNRKLRDDIENELSLFITTRYKYIYIVDRKEGEYHFLLDGSKKDKAIYLEPYEPLELEKWDRVFKTKKDFYFTHTKIETLWITYLKPILIKGRVVAVLVIDFSMKDHSKMLNALDKLSRGLELSLLFFVFTFVVIVTFSFIDLKRDREKIKVQKELEKSLNKLEKLNETLEEKVKIEVEKNREKDRQLLYQSKLAQMGEMMSMIAHQWRQPLSSISSIALSLHIKSELGGVDKSLVKDKTKLINKNVDYLSKTIDDFRNFFQPTKEEEVINFETIIDSVLNISNISLQNRNIALSIELGYNKKIKLFSNELKQVLLNFIKNSEDVLVERKIENKHIFIRSYKSDSDIVLEVEDNGGGVSKELENKIFEPYFSTKHSKNGTGLGLYMSKIIVEEHLKGDLKMVNTKDGVIFRIILKDKNG